MEKEDFRTLAESGRLAIRRRAIKMIESGMLKKEVAINDYCKPYQRSNRICAKYPSKIQKLFICLNILPIKIYCIFSTIFSSDKSTVECVYRAIICCVTLVCAHLHQRITNNIVYLGTGVKRCMMKPIFQS